MKVSFNISGGDQYTVGPYFEPEDVSVIVRRTLERHGFEKKHDFALKNREADFYALAQKQWFFLDQYNIRNKDAFAALVQESDQKIHFVLEELFEELRLEDVLNSKDELLSEVPEFLREEIEKSMEHVQPLLDSLEDSFEGMKRDSRKAYIAVLACALTSFRVVYNKHDRAQKLELYQTDRDAFILDEGILSECANQVLSSSVRQDTVAQCTESLAHQQAIEYYENQSYPYTGMGWPFIAAVFWIGFSVSMFKNARKGFSTNEALSDLVSQKGFLASTNQPEAPSPSEPK